MKYKEISINLLFSAFVVLFFSRCTSNYPHQYYPADLEKLPENKLVKLIVNEPIRYLNIDGKSMRVYNGAIIYLSPGIHSLKYKKNESRELHGEANETHCLSTDYFKTISYLYEESDTVFSLNKESDIVFSLWKLVFLKGSKIDGFYSGKSFELLNFGQCGILNFGNRPAGNWRMLFLGIFELTKDGTNIYGILKRKDYMQSIERVKVGNQTITFGDQNRWYAERLK